MSNNPFSDKPNSENPYASPGTQYAPPPLTREQVKARLLPPAVAILSLAAVSIVARLVLAAFEFALPGPDGNDATVQASRMTGQIAGQIVGLVFNVVAIVGSIDMLKLKSFRNAQIGAVVTVIPCCSPCFVLGIPFGIWALVILRQPGVRESFTQP